MSPGVVHVLTRAASGRVAAVGACFDTCPAAGFDLLEYQRRRAMEDCHRNFITAQCGTLVADVLDNFRVWDIVNKLVDKGTLVDSWEAVGDHGKEQEG